jgi:peroxiredoxin
LRTLLFSTFTALCLVSFSQSQAKPFSFKIEGKIRNHTGTYIYLHHRWEDRDHTDSAKIEQGRFTFKLQSIDPNMYWLTVGRQVTDPHNTLFFVDKVTLKASLVADSMASSTVTGGPTQKDYIEYRDKGATFALKQQQLQGEYTLANQKGDMAAVNQVQLNYQELGVKYIDDLKAFVKSHPRSAVSGYIIFKEFSTPNIPVEYAEECLSYLDKSIEDTKFAKLARKKINDVKGTLMGAQATDFSQSTPDGKKISLSDFKGQYVLVDFWASWCRPCRLENPNVVAAFNKFKDKGFTVLGVSLDSNKDQWIAAIQADGLAWTQVCDLKGGANEAAMLYGIQTIPQNVLIDKTGKIIAKNLRGPALEQKLAELVH